MSEQTGTASGRGNRSPNTAAMQAGRAAKDAARKARPEISPVAKLGISQARTAKRVCGLIVSYLETGGDVSPEVMRACGQLAMVGSEMVAG